MSLTPIGRIFAPSDPSEDMMGARARALDYPYTPVSESLTLTPTGTIPFDVRLTDGRTPVLAIGSNRAPAQLRHKFSHDDSLPVECVALMDHDVVYAARVSGYGAIPATLAESPGTCVDIAITWLTPRQLEVMDRSEGLGTGYFWANVPARCIRLARSLEMQFVGCYVAARGAFTYQSELVALEGVCATGRRYSAWNSRQVLRQAALDLYPAEPFDGVLERLISEPDFRAEVRARLGDVGVFEQGVLRGQPFR